MMAAELRAIGALETSWFQAAWLGSDGARARARPAGRERRDSRRGRDRARAPARAPGCAERGDQRGKRPGDAHPRSTTLGGVNLRCALAMARPVPREPAAARRPTPPPRADRSWPADRDPTDRQPPDRKAAHRRGPDGKGTDSDRPASLRPAGAERPAPRPQQGAGTPPRHPPNRSATLEARGGRSSAGRAPGCGPGGRRFESGRPPFYETPANGRFGVDGPGLNRSQILLLIRQFLPDQRKIGGDVRQLAPIQPFTSPNQLPRLLMPVPKKDFEVSIIDDVIGEVTVVAQVEQALDEGDSRQVIRILRGGPASP